MGRFLGRRDPPRIVTREPPRGVRQVRDIVPRGPSEGVIRLGQKLRWYNDFYHRVLVLRWGTFTLMAFAFYLLLNLLFAGLYLLQAGTIEHSRPGSFADAFFFSIQTMATIGYGVLTPLRQLREPGGHGRDDGGASVRHLHHRQHLCPLLPAKLARRVQPGHDGGAA